MVDAALDALADFASLYATDGRPSIAPEGSFERALYRFCSQSDLLFRWFVGLLIDEDVRVPTVFTKSRDRLLTTEMSRKLMTAILAHEKVAPLLSNEHLPSMARWWQRGPDARQSP